MLNLPPMNFCPPLLFSGDITPGGDRVGWGVYFTGGEVGFVGRG